MVDLVRIITDCQYDSNYQPETQSRIIAKAVIEALAAEAEKTRMIASDSRLDYDDYRVATGMQWNLDRWLRSHLTDPEATT